MCAKPIGVYWQGQLIGSIIRPKVDHYTIYGKWEPVSGSAYEEFLAARSKENEPYVMLGIGDDLPATIQDIGDGEIECKIRPRR
jgi:hypothetical protein